MKFNWINPGSIDSTNRFAVELVEKERPPEGTIIITDHQLNGQGLDSNSWESAPGKNLTFTIVFYPHFIGASRQFAISIAVSLGLLKAVNAYLCGATDLRIKWPNDVYAGNHKLAGMLIQHSVINNSIDYTIAGIGLNVNQRKFGKSIPNPISMATLSGVDYDLNEVGERVVSSIGALYERMHNEMDAQRSEYYEYLYRINQWYQYRVRSEEVTAMVTGVDAYGRLVLSDRDGGTMVCDLKEVQYIL